ncbi:unnamed protein product [Callosobruchus maculatus]|uniref:ADF-H domain-containing protein n=1 Tax=Callosobruchus maculatus TaxID=64391 RepID=A0A653C2B0_CALMS|nr:unnamed protein product [Callosobruchus maculatus]
MASGVTVSDDCKRTYEEIKKDKKHRYVIFYIKDERQIDVEVVGARDEEYDKREERANAVTDCTTSSICTNAKAPQNLPRNRNCS